MIYGYGRVSTPKQAKDGNSLDIQESQLRENGAEQIFLDAYTGTVANRPEFDKVCAMIKEGDTLIITKLDRIARSVNQGTKIIEELLNRGVVVNVLNLGKMDNSPNGKLIRNIMLSFAEFERDMIVERTQEGRRIAKKNKSDYREGRPKKYSKAQIKHAMELLETHSYTQVVEMTGISKATLYREHCKYVPEPIVDEGVPGQMDISEFIGSEVI